MTTPQMALYMNAVGSISRRRYIKNELCKSFRKEVINLLGRYSYCDGISGGSSMKWYSTRLPNELIDFLEIGHFDIRLGH